MQNLKKAVQWLAGSCPIVGRELREGDAFMRYVAVVGKDAKMSNGRPSKEV